LCKNILLYATIVNCHERAQYIRSCIYFQLFEMFKWKEIEKFVIWTIFFCGFRHLSIILLSMKKITFSSNSWKCERLTVTRDLTQRHWIFWLTCPRTGYISHDFHITCNLMKFIISLTARKCIPLPADERVVLSRGAEYEAVMYLEQKFCSTTPRVLFAQGIYAIFIGVEKFSKNLGNCAHHFIRERRRRKRTPIYVYACPCVSVCVHQFRESF